MEMDWHAERTDLANLALLDTEHAGEPIDLVAVRAYRLGRVRSEMAKRGIAACVLHDQVNIRYATGARNMQIFSSRNTGRYLLLTERDAILYEFTGAMHLADGLETLTGVRPAITASFVAAGEKIAERESLWARETAAALRELVGARATIGVERMNAGAAAALAAEGFRLVDAQEPVEMARCIKSPEEMKCVRASLRATEKGVERLRAAIRPGLTENALWSVLHQAVIAQDGDYIETRLLNSGPRTNPWFQETGPRMIGENELIALDTDVVGCHGYYADFSRTFHAGPGAPSAKQRELYRTAHEQVHFNMGIIEPGMSFRDYAERAWEIPEKYFANRYYLSSHGVGMTGEYPYLYHRADFPDAGYDGVIEPGMTLCVESFIGEESGGEGVKLEQQILVTESGIELLSHFPFEDALLG
ncbi:Xaa-Pro peptidase family protein [Nisaea acidiphila]|uniref:Xaa-Pro peptidase family protein n=1 Tax=Nisaea acidiphila TaxID=1862145 RepID=A0A9J7AR62_9PROT|nr:Xaa-Pro peptidase family protein [Nisaea acidiphila]UUX49686.1 Xaa-Pro peptidase family protein [Nisaea acidiphila]